MKKCWRCGEVKPPDAFWKNKRARDGLQTYCKHCLLHDPELSQRRQYLMKRHQAKEETKARRRMKAYPESAQSRQNRLASQRHYAKTAAHRESQKHFRESPPGRYGQLRSQAARRGKEVSVTLEQFIQLIRQPCHYCRSELTPTGIGLDRVDPTSGYHVNNVVPCCGPCNATRGITWTYQEMLALGPVVARLKAERAGGGGRPLRLCDYLNPRGVKGTST